ncbi:MAG: NAD(P)H-dependent oxidoreductase subunit E, partial [Candidatus Lambdaproteobacteria bacterium]|nr:NAD(P)H-dependent oxidoreductase subunit E [Candidatus Lambdaproteobacteria bacterium]
RRIQVCRDVSCHMRGAQALLAQLRQAAANANVTAPGIEVEEVSCLGRCDSAPAVALDDHPLAGPVERILALARSSDPVPPLAAPPVRRWPTDPHADGAAHYSIAREIAARGDAGREAVLAALRDSGLRGMGGAGFPTGNKWAFTRQAPGEIKYVVCNADESEPGTYKDRAILAELPHLVIEGMILGGFVIGAERGILYLRHEYAPERAAIEGALERARAAGVLGRAVFGGGRPYDIEVFVSPGGYIMGEETALFEALEDRRGEPRNKPPFPTTHGLFGKPTLINNVETFAAVPAILCRGAAWWAAQGVGGCKGLKFISVSGDVARPGVYCVPMGTPVRELLALCGGVGGGVAAGKPLLAFAPGGASSRFLPADKLDVALDFAALQQAGSMLGSGAVIFVAEGRDLVELAANEVRFFRNESCGKCVPCRLGTEKAVALVDEALAGRPRAGLVPLLRDLGKTLGRTSICGLGQVALEPLLSVLDNFPEAARQRLGDLGARGNGGRP